MEDLSSLYSSVAFYLSDGTTARLRLAVPVNRDTVVHVEELLFRARKSDKPIPVDSLDSDNTRSGEEMFILPAHIVAFVVTP